MWWERFVIIVGGVAHDFPPHSWGLYAPRLVEYCVMVGSFSLFFFLFLLFCKHMPSVSMTEMKETATPCRLKPASWGCSRTTAPPPGPSRTWGGGVQFPPRPQPDPQPQDPGGPEAEEGPGGVVHPGGGDPGFFFGICAGHFHIHPLGPDRQRQADHLPDSVFHRRLRVHHPVFGVRQRDRAARLLRGCRTTRGSRSTIRAAPASTSGCWPPARAAARAN